MDLFNTKKGHIYKIKTINGGKSFINKMESMGILPGTKIEKVNANIGGGPVIITVGTSKYALGRGMASKIKVTEYEDG